MKRIITLMLTLILTLSMLAGCGQSTDERPEPLGQNEISTMTSDVDVEDTEKVIEQKQSNMNDKVVEMETVALVNDELYRDAYYGVPVKMGEDYYKIPAIKIMNYYFVDTELMTKMTNIKFAFTDSGIEITAPETVKIDYSKLEKGTITPESINVDEVKLLSDKEILAVNYRNKHYISLISLRDYTKGSDFYFNRNIGAITNTKPDITKYPAVNKNGLLRKNISINDKLELVVRESSSGKMLVIYDIYGSSLDITPNDVLFAKDLQNIFLHKTEDTIYMFGLMGNSVQVYTIEITEELEIKIVSIGTVQRIAQNIYYLDGKYVAVGRGDIFGIGIDNKADENENKVYEINLKQVVNTHETGGDFNVIDGEKYLSVKDTNGKIVVYKLNMKDFSLEKITDIVTEISIDETPNNFFYSFVEDDKISIYLMDNVGYIYNVQYDIKNNTTELYQTDTFRLFYTEDNFPVELAINMVKANESGESELSLVVNGKYLGNNIIIFGIEDNWVYCAEYVDSGDAYTVHAFRYNAITGVRDYSNLA